MKKKTRNLYRFLLIFSYLTLTTNIAQSQGAFDDLFKGFDFDSFLKDMEKAYDDESDKKTFGAPTKAPVTAATATTAGSEKTIITKTPAKIPQTRDELFLTPVTQTVQEKGKSAQTKLTYESLKAFREVMHEFVSLLNSVATKVDGARMFPLPFKEQFAQFHEYIDAIAIAYGTIVSKKMYTTILPFQQAPEAAKPGQKAAPNAKQPQVKETADLRKNILDAIKELKALDKDLAQDITAEEKETESTVIKELSKKKRKKVTFEKATLAGSSKRKSHDEPKKKAKDQPLKKDKKPLVKKSKGQAIAIPVALNESKEIS